MIDAELIPQVAARFKALSDEGRLALLSALQRGEKSVGELAEATHRSATQRVAAPREPHPRRARGGAAGRHPGLLPHRRPDRPADLRRGLRQPVRPGARGKRQAIARPGNGVGPEETDEDERRARAWPLGRARGGVARAGARTCPVTLAEALALAEKANPELQAAAARVEAQLAADRVRAPDALAAARPDDGLVAHGPARRRLREQAELGRVHGGGLRRREASTTRAPSATSAPTCRSSCRSTCSARSARWRARWPPTATPPRPGRSDATLEIRMRVVEAYRQAEMAGRAVAVMERAVAVAKAREAEIQARVETGAARCRRTCCARARGAGSARPSSRSARPAGGWRRRASPGCSAHPPVSATSRPRGRPPSRPSTGDEAAWAERSLRQRPALEAARRKTDAASALLREREERPAARHRRLRPAVGQTASRWTTASSRGPWVSACAGRRSTHRGASARRRRPRSSRAAELDAARGRPTRCAWRSRWPTAGR